MGELQNEQFPLVSLQTGDSLAVGHQDPVASIYCRITDSRAYSRNLEQLKAGFDLFEYLPRTITNITIVIRVARIIDKRKNEND